jgi:prepilin-type N-terminal cleavage/methylation domain-containing protein
MLKIKKILYNKGFSLIELMVAVVILSMAIFGIFQAYSVGFMGMADARDRTVATNYLQEKIEDFKNMDFNKVKDERVTLIPGTKFHRGSIVLDLEKQGEVVTLKRVITQVRWMDREGKIKTEEASTLLYNKPNTSEVGDTAIEIVLYAESYYTILPEHTVKLIAEIRDEKGNIFDWDGPITFSVITDPVNDPPFGNITTSQPVGAVNGIAVCIFTAIEGSDVEGIERIQASATINGNLLTDSVNIRVTTGPVGIVISPATEGDKILSADIGNISTINLTVVKADYIELVEYNNPITLSAVGPVGWGNLSKTTIDSVPTEGTTFNLTSNGIPGIVEITASAPDLDMGYTEVTFTGEATSILVSTKKKSIYPNEETTITVTIIDKNNTPVSFGTSSDSKFINLTGSPKGYGTFDISSLEFKGDSFKTCVFKAYTKEVIDGLILPQEITITAIDSLSNLKSGSINIKILSSLVAHHIDVTFDPSIIELDNPSIEPSKITAIMKSEEGDIVYGNFITFVITSGPGSFSLDESTSETTLTGGMATATLYPFEVTSTGKAYIEIYSNDLESNVDGPPGNPGNPIEIEVLFHQESAPHHINLVADPSYIFVGGQTCTLEAKVVDESNVTYSDYNGRVRFTITGDTSSVNYGTLEIDALNGIAILNLNSTDNAGTIYITAKTLDLISEYNYDSEVTSFLTTVNINAISIELVDNSIYYYDNNKIIKFNINIEGPEIILNDMKVEWGSSPSKLKKIEIKSPSTDDSYDPIIDVGNVSSPYTKVNINTNLLPGESTIRLTFSKDMLNISVTLTFYTDHGEYIVPIVE